MAEVIRINDDTYRIEGASQILSGEAKGEKVEVFGQEILKYDFGYAGFLGELRE